MLMTAEEDDYSYTDVDIIPDSVVKTLEADYSAVEEGPFLEGDIIPSASNVMYHESDLRWPNATVPFRFHNMMSIHGRTQVLRAMNQYNRHTCIQFKKRTTEKDYLGGPQMLHLSSACTRSVGTPMHELMHALGFFHEHMRPDRDRYVHINYSNIDHDLWRNFKEVYTKGTMQESGAGYDFGSLMHYRLCAMTNNSWPTIVPKVKPMTDDIGQRRGFSNDDILKLNSFYNCSSLSRSPRLFTIPSSRQQTRKSRNQTVSLFSHLIMHTLCFLLLLNCLVNHCLVFNYTS